MIEPVTDKEAIVSRLKSGDEDAFREIFTPLRDPLIRAIHKIVNSWDDAEDICQDTFAVLWEQREEIDPNKNINAFIFIIARRITYKYLRKIHYADDLSDIHNAYTYLDSSPDEIMQAKEDEFLVKYVIDRLSPRTREIYDFHYTEGLSYEQIADRLDINTANVKAQIHQARAKIKDILAAVLLFMSL
jgi:RNA polymerase sigma-70 factor (ECF subfamily)